MKKSEWHGRLDLHWWLVLGLVLLVLGSMRWGWWRSSGVGAQVQIPMFYDAHYLYPRAWTQSQEAPSVPPPDPISLLYGPNQVTQSFFIGSEYVSLVEVWLAGPVGTPVQATLVTANGQRYMTEIVIERATGQAYWLQWPDMLVPQRAAVTLAAPMATVAAPVTTYSVGGDRLGGAIRVNEYARPGNLALHSYAQGLPGLWWTQAIGEQLLPDTFLLRVQQYKPMLFKGGVFPALVGMMMLLSIIFLVLARPTGWQPLERVVGWSLVILLAAFWVWQVADGRLRFGIPTLMLQPTEQTPSVELAEARLVHDFALVLWAAVREPEERFIEMDMVNGLSAIRVPGESRLKFVLDVPQNGRLRTGVVAEAGDEMAFVVRFNGETIAETTTDATEWLDIDLTPWQGQSGSLVFVTNATVDGTQGVWLMPQITAVADWLQPAPLLAEAGIVATEYRFNKVIALVGYGAVPIADQLKVTLYWQGLERTSAQGTVFVHLVDGDGNIISQHDGQPVSNSYPISSWLPDTIVRDEHWLSLPDGGVLAEGAIALGVYDPVTLTRWRVTGVGETAVVDDRIVLPLPR